MSIEAIVKTKVHYSRRSIHAPLSLLKRNLLCYRISPQAPAGSGPGGCIALCRSGTNSFPLPQHGMRSVRLTG